MSNRRELAMARRRVEDAQRSLADIERLPRRVGQQVIWTNGVVWTRVGDDRWRPWSEHQPDDMPDLLYPSEHVASGHWTRP